MNSAHHPPGAARGTVDGLTARTRSSWSGKVRVRRGSQRTTTIQAVADVVPSLPAMPSATAQPAQDLEGLWDQHGASVYALAHALLGDEQAAVRAVRLGMEDVARAADVDQACVSHRFWAHHVFLRSQDILAEAPVTPRPAPRWLEHLAPLQRACVALCLFGGHTYREVASLLGLQPLAVADLLTTALAGQPGEGRAARA